MIDKIAILTSPNQWFVSYAERMEKEIKNSKVFFNHKEIDSSYDVVFILSYHTLIKKKYLNLHNFNLVIHESALPKGKGWAPLFWQVLEGKQEIVFTMFEASDSVDNGDIYFQKILTLTGYELNEELRQKQANLIIKMCKDFIKNYEEYKIPTPQKGEESFFSKRTPKDSEIDINKTIQEQFNLFRIVNNKEYPAFFYKDSKKYILKIEEVKDENR